jgi:hypothetical protein
LKFHSEIVSAVVKEGMLRLFFAETWVCCLWRLLVGLLAVLQVADQRQPRRRRVSKAE